MQLKDDIVVGGDFEIAIPQYKNEVLPIEFQEGYYYSSGRAALYAIIQHIEETRKDIKTILIPDYICHSVIETIQKTHLAIEVYHLTRTFLVPEEVVGRGNLDDKAILLVNYFGLMSLEKDIQRLRIYNKYVCIIEDNVQSLLSMFEPSSADYRFTSFRKALPVPDGGWVKTKYAMLQPERINRFAQYKIAGGILKGLRHYQCFDDSLYLKMLETGEEKIDENLDKSISQFTLDTLANQNLVRFKTLRVRNAEYLVKHLAEIGITPMISYSEGCVPLFIPICLRNRNIVRNALFAKQIFCPVHWPIPNEGYAEYTMAMKMQEVELSLIVDQRYNTQIMQEIINTIKEYL